MYLIRPILKDDLDAFVTLVGRADHGLTSLPKDRAILEQRIATSVASMQTTERPRYKSGYLLVLVDSERDGLAGCCGLYGQIGGEVPYFAYQLDSIRIGEAIDMPRDIRVLRVLERPRGPAMVGSLLLDPSCRGVGVGRFLSLVRFLFMADHRLRFEHEVIAELRGWIDERGGSPFWDAVGRHFFQMDLPEADMNTHSVQGFVQHLLPRQPIFIDMLPTKAQQIIGAVHPKTRPALDILKDEGFTLTPWLDPFEAGPILTAEVGNLRTIKTSRVLEAVVCTDDMSPLFDGRYAMVSNRSSGDPFDYRAVMTPVWEAGSEVIGLTEEAFELLGVSAGSMVRLAAIPASRRQRALSLGEEGHP